MILVNSCIQFWTYRPSLHQYPVQVIEQQALSTSILPLLLSIQWSLAPCTSSRYLNNCYHLSLPPPSGIFTTCHCHILQVSLQHITTTFSCPRGCIGGGSIINGATSSSFLLLPFSSYSWFCSSSWTLDTRY